MDQDRSHHETCDFSIVERYLAIFPMEKHRLQKVSANSNSGGLAFERQAAHGHVTASGLVIDNDRILLIFHPYLKKWLQPGGHIETGETSVQAALQETEEETGLRVELNDWHSKHRCPLDIDIHHIPANDKKTRQRIGTSIFATC